MVETALRVMSQLIKAPCQNLFCFHCEPASGIRLIPGRPTEGALGLTLEEMPRVKKLSIPIDAKKKN